MIAGLLLAAGGARRFGSQKLVAPLDGVPLVRYAAATLVAVTDLLIVVVGNASDAVRDALHDIPARVVDNPEWETGLSSSIRAGIAAAEESNADAVLVMLGDEPRVDPTVVQNVVMTWRATGSAIVAPRYRGTRGHPVLFDRSVFRELNELHGDVGARTVFERLPDRVAYVDVDSEPPRDVDTPNDIERVSMPMPVPMPMLTIAKLDPDDRPAWEELFRAYITFYGRTSPPEMYERAWSAFQEDSRMHALGAKLDGRLVGITHFLIHANTSAPDVCYLQDLFTAPDARGKGVAGALIAAVGEWARARGCCRLYWMTHESNATARRLYDRVAENRGFIRYQVELG